jgi:transposase
MDERLRFVARLLEGEKMSPLCREFGISRVTGYKIFNRYKDCGLHGLNDRSRAPYRQANRLPYQVERTILGIKKEHDTWGARKIRDKLIKQFPMVPTPAISTVHAVLDRHGLVKRKKRRRYKAQGTPLVAARQPNELSSPTRRRTRRGRAQPPTRRGPGARTIHSLRRPAPRHCTCLLRSVWPRLPAGLILQNPLLLPELPSEAHARLR